MKNLNLLLMTMLLSFGGATAQAGKMDSETQNLVIEKLERILDRMKKEDSSTIPSMLRLADSLAERARSRFMLEVEENCEGCKGSGADRKRALGLYTEALPRASAGNQGLILIQMAHLHDMAGDSIKARSLYQTILNNSKKHDKKLVTQARISYADSLYEAGDFKNAQAQAEIVLKDPKAPQRGLMLYRIAWSQFNQGQLPKATTSMERLASSPALLTKESPDGYVADNAFRLDVLRDLATFYSRAVASDAKISKFSSLIPVDSRKELLLFFAEEVDRLGQKAASARLYSLYLKEPNLSAEERLSASMGLTQARMDQGEAKQANQDFAAVAAVYLKNGCKEEKACDNIRKQMKRYVIDLHRLRKAKPDSDVLGAYKIYAKTFPEQADMAILGAQVAVELKDSKSAANLYRQAADRTTDAKLRETALLAEIDSAERANSRELRAQAYAHYMEMNPKGPKNFEVRYQQAQLSYEVKDFKAAGPKFRILALDQTGSASLRKKSADLALDSLATQKDDEEIEAWSNEFAVAFPTASDEFNGISRRSVLNQTAKVSNNDKSSKSELSKALKKMRQVNLAKAPDSEKIVHLKNQAILAEKVSDDEALMAALGGLLAVKSLSATERENTMARQVGFHEKKLNFRAAYQIALRLKMDQVSKAQRELRLGTLADLGGLNAGNHYRNALKAGLSGEQGASVRSRLVLTSASPLRELKAHQNELSRFPSILGDIVVVIYGKTRNAKALESVMGTPRMARSKATKFIRKQAFYAKQDAVEAKVARHQLDLSTDRKMQKTIQQRIALLKEADMSLKEALRWNDFTAQVRALSLVARENERMASDLGELPLPKGLTDAEKVRYEKLMKDQTRPFTEKASVAQSKAREFWDNDQAVNALLTDLKRSRREVRPIIENEVRALSKVAPSRSLKSRLESAIASDDSGPDDLASARESVRSEPQNTREIEKLKDLETRMGHPLMAVYLESRLERIQKGNTL